MNEPSTPMMLPSPVDLGEYRFVAIDALGREWRWVDDELVWVLAEADGVKTTNAPPWQLPLDPVRSSRRHRQHRAEQSEPT